MQQAAVQSKERPKQEQEQEQAGPSRRAKCKAKPGESVGQRQAPRTDVLPSRRSDTAKRSKCEPRRNSGYKPISCCNSSSGTMPRKKPKVDTLEEIETGVKLFCDQSNNHMKVREYDKALFGYNQVCAYKN